jgi:hypothetical protein
LISIKMQYFLQIKSIEDCNDGLSHPVISMLQLTQIQKFPGCGMSCFL